MILQGQDLLRVKRHANDDFRSVPKVDTEAYDCHVKSEKDNLSYDLINEEILSFCSTLFLTWLDDYEVAASRIQDEIAIHHHYYMNEGVKKNVREKCLPIEYFAERMLQVGLVSKMTTLKCCIEIML